MTCKQLEELAAGHALGALDRDEAAQLEMLMAHDADVRGEVSTFTDAAAAVASAAVPRVAPSEGLRARILAGVAATAQEAQPPPIPIAAAAGFRFVLNGPEGWVDTGIPGVRGKLLSRGPQRGYKVMLIAVAPGAKLPDHDHAGTEDLFMLSGHLHTQGHLMGPGDFLRSEAGTRHELISPDGCVALVVNGPAVTA